MNIQTEPRIDTSVNRILFVRTDAIGDNVIALGMIPHIQSRFPTAEISVVCQDHIAPLYRTCPMVGEVISYEHDRALGEDSYLKRLLGKLQALRPDLALNTVFSSTVLTHVLSLGNGAPNKIGFHGDLSNISAGEQAHFMKYYSSLIEVPGESRTEVEKHQWFLKGIGVRQPAEPQPVIWTDADHEQFADDVMRRYGLQPSSTIALFSGGQEHFKHFRGYGGALSKLCTERGFRVIALGAPNEYHLNQDNLDALGGCGINLCGHTSILEAAALMKRCLLGVGSDTSHAHIACAVGLRSVILLGGGHFGRFLPYSPLTSVVCLPLECYGCNWRCRYETYPCIANLDPNVFASAVRATLENCSDTPRVFFQSQVPPHGEQPFPSLASPNTWVNSKKITTVPIESSPAPCATPATKRLVVVSDGPEYWQDCQIIKERCDDSPGIIMLGHGDSNPTPERVTALDRCNYYVISTSCSRDDNPGWIPHARCLGALLHGPGLVSEARSRFPEKIFERMNCVMINFFRIATQSPAWMANLAGLSFRGGGDPALKTIDIASCWTSVPLKRTELMIEAAMQRNLSAYLISMEFGTREAIVHRIRSLATQYGRPMGVFYHPFEPYALEQVGENIIIDGRPMGINNGVVASILDKTRVYVHTSETEGIPNSIVEALLRNVPVVMCNDVLGPMPQIASEISPCITLADPTPDGVGQAVSNIIANYKDYSGVQATFRRHFDPFEVNRRVIRHCQSHFEKGGIPWKGTVQGICAGMFARYNLAADIPGFEQVIGQRPIYPSLDLAMKYLAYQISLAKRSGNAGAEQLLEREREIVTDRWTPR